MSRNIWGSKTREAVANGVLWVEARNAAGCSSEHRIDHKTVVSINVNFSKGEKGHTRTVPILHHTGNSVRLCLGSPLDNLVPLETTCSILSIAKQGSLLYKRTCSRQGWGTNRAPPANHRGISFYLLEFCFQPPLVPNWVGK